MRLIPLLSLCLVVGACSSGTPAAPAQPPTTDGGAAAVTAAPSAPPANGAIAFPDWPRTNFTKLAADLSEIERGCPVRDCIPPLDAPGATSIAGSSGGRASFLPVAQQKYEAQLPVAYVVVEGKARGYPLHILTWHEVVNDHIGATPFVATFCPLCNTALAFDRRVDGRVLDFGVSGNLRNSDLIMWDRQTESWWQQATGEGIVGDFAGKTLKGLPMAIVSYAEFAAAFPEADILTEDTGVSREYGVNPYAGYDTRGSAPFLFSGKPDRRLDLLERVVTLNEGGATLALPFAALSDAKVANVVVGGRDVAVFWAPGTLSALDKPLIADSRQVGAAVALDRRVANRVLTFEPLAPGRFRDRETGSTWDITGLAVEGAFAGRRLEPVVHSTQFWFAWAAFHPGAEIWAP